MIVLEVDDREAIADPVAALSHLLARPEPAHRQHIKLTNGIDDEDRHEARTSWWDTFYQDFKDVVQRLAYQWGAPDFDGGYRDPGYPEEFWWSPYLAYWIRGERVAYVGCDQQDNECPLELFVGTVATNDLHPRQGPLEWELLDSWEGADPEGAPDMVDPR